MHVKQLQLPSKLRAIQSSVQHNCHISDARFASNYTICVYLLKMREYFRWEKGYSYAAALPHEEVSEWLTDREDLWEGLEETDFLPVEIDGMRFDPFDSQAINQALQVHELLYSAGYGNKAKPHFFLARLVRKIEHKGYEIYVSDQEFARDLTAPPAMSLDRQIFIRRESLRRMIWEKLEEWRWNKPDNAMGRAIGYYDFNTDLERALDQMTEAEIDTLILHEIGEVKAGEMLGNRWREMLDSFPRSRLEFMARAVRDHLADALSTLPTLLEREHPPSMHFYFANLSGMRKQIYPSLLNAYAQWVKYGDTDKLVRQVELGREHWLQVAQALLKLHEQQSETAWEDMESLIEQRYL